VQATGDVFYYLSSGHQTYTVKRSDGNGKWLAIQVKYILPFAVCRDSKSSRMLCSFLTSKKRDTIGCFLFFSRGAMNAIWRPPFLKSPMWSIRRQAYNREIVTNLQYLATQHHLRYLLLKLLAYTYHILSDLPMWLNGSGQVSFQVGWMCNLLCQVSQPGALGCVPILQLSPPTST